jgi:S1-C subfamily serine protease
MVSQRSRVAQSLGSGVIVSSDGYISRTTTSSAT